MRSTLGAPPQALLIEPKKTKTGTVIIEPFQVKDARTGKTPYHSYTSKGDSSAVNYIIKNGKLCPMSIRTPTRSNL